MSTYTYKYNNNQEQREIFFQELCQCQDTNLANIKKYEPSTSIRGIYYKKAKEI